MESKLQKEQTMATTKERKTKAQADAIGYIIFFNDDPLDSGDDSGDDRYFFRTIEEAQEACEEHAENCDAERGEYAIHPVGKLVVLGGEVRPSIEWDTML
jgi:hypothetical protein